MSEDETVIEQGNGYEHQGFFPYETFNSSETDAVGQHRIGPMWDISKQNEMFSNIPTASHVEQGRAQIAVKSESESRGFPSISNRTNHPILRE